MYMLTKYFPQIHVFILLMVIAMVLSLALFQNYERECTFISVPEYGVCYVTIVNSTESCFLRDYVCPQNINKCYFSYQGDNQCNISLTDPITNEKIILVLLLYVFLVMAALIVCFLPKLNTVYRVFRLQCSDNKLTCV